MGDQHDFDLKETQENNNYCKSFGKLQVILLLNSEGKFGRHGRAWTQRGEERGRDKITPFQDLWPVMWKNDVMYPNFWSQEKKKNEGSSQEDSSCVQEITH